MSAPAAGFFSVSLKRIKRWKHEGVLDAMQARLDGMPDAMGVRRQTVEHPFGTMDLLRKSGEFPYEQ
jgi:hypothetical protein